MPMQLSMRLTLVLTNMSLQVELADDEFLKGGSSEEVALAIARRAWRQKSFDDLGVIVLKLNCKAISGAAAPLPCLSLQNHAGVPNSALNRDSVLIKAVSVDSDKATSGAPTTLSSRDIDGAPSSPSPTSPPTSSASLKTPRKTVSFKRPRRVVYSSPPAQENSFALPCSVPTPSSRHWTLKALKWGLVAVAVGSVALLSASAVSAVCTERRSRK
jgi:hypothetical protein